MQAECIQAECMQAECIRAECMQAHTTHYTLHTTHGTQLEYTQISDYVDAILIPTVSAGHLESRFIKNPYHNNDYHRIIQKIMTNILCKFGILNHIIPN